MNLNETVGVDAARLAHASNFAVETYGKVNWDVVGPTMVILIVLAMFCVYNREVIAYFWAKSPFARWRERQQMRAEREKKLREILSDNILDAIDEAFLDKDITAEERQWAFEAIGKLGFPDLRAKATTLKEEIIAKRAAEKKEEPATVTTMSIL
jgi:hypothetical protein